MCADWLRRSRHYLEDGFSRAVTLQRTAPDSHALLQHRRPDPAGHPLPRPSAGAVGPGPSAHAHPAAEVLRAARAASDGQDVGASETARRTQRGRGFPLRLRERRARAGRTRGRRRRDARHPRRDGVRRGACAGRHHGEKDGSGSIGDGRPAPGPARDACPMGRIGRQAAGTRHRRDRLAHRRYAAVGPATAPCGIRGPAATFSTDRDPLRRARRARLPHSIIGRERSRGGRQRLQHPSRVAAPTRLFARRGRVASRSAHPRDRPVLHRRCARRVVGPHPWSALARECPGLRDMLRAA